MPPNAVIQPRYLRRKGEALAERQHDISTGIQRLSASSFGANLPAQFGTVGDMLNRESYNVQASEASVLELCKRDMLWLQVNNYNYICFST